MSVKAAEMDISHQRFYSTVCSTRPVDAVQVVGRKVAVSEKRINAKNKIVIVLN